MKDIRFEHAWTHKERSKLVHSQNAAMGAAAAGIGIGTAATVKKSLPLALGSAGASGVALLANHRANMISRREFEKPTFVPERHHAR